ncbi:MAG TPA: SpoIIE family protein phosphatase, partial [Candidatus Ozemobacteraceae bacterium]|nr:SpoIIE family protein phosphatase [Candidatus Ozemobacteraceae bacterium]
LAVTGYDDLQKTRDVLIESGRRQLEENLSAVENGFEKFGRTYAVKLSRLRDAYNQPGHSFDHIGFARALDTLTKTLGGKSPALILESGKVIRITELTGQKGERETMLEAVCIELLRRYNRSIGVADSRPDRLALASLVLDDRTAKNLLTGVIRSRGQLNHLNFGAEDKFVYMNFILDASGGAAGVFFVNWDPKDLAYYYLKHDILRRQRLLAHSRLYALHEWDASRSIPDKAAGAGWLKKFVERLQVRRTRLFDELTTDGRRWLVGGVPGRELQAYMLIQALPLDRLTGPVDGLTSDLIWGGALCLLLSLGVATALARQILRPVAILTSGVDAMRTGRFRTRLPVLDHDEFGVLTVSFNQALERLEELSTAKAFQERLFPGDALRVGNAEVVGICRTASELGGDYFDYFDIGENRVVILIGDVAGHGAGSALLMAMAKGFIAVETRRDCDPAHVLSGLNDMIFTAMSRRLMMSMCYGLLHTKTGILTIANAGHCPPLLVRKGASEAVELLTGVGYPLGTRRNPSYKCQEVRLEPGDRVWFFTDGFPEMPGTGGEPLGYPGLAAMIMTVDGSDGESRCRRLHGICAAYRSGKPQPDDMTAIHLEYREKP